jgi:hypothetical protein
MQYMTIYFFEPISFYGKVISWITGSKFSHAAFSFEGKFYHSSELTGRFCEMEPKELERDFHVMTIELKDPERMREWLKSMEGKPYDWKGVLGWIFKIQDKRKYHCFETVYMAILHSGYTDKPMPERVSASTLIEVLRWPI